MGYRLTAPLVAIGRMTTPCASRVALGRSKALMVRARVNRPHDHVTGGACSTKPRKATLGAPCVAIGRARPR